LLILRIIGLFALIAIGVSFALYVYTRQRRYLQLAWRIFFATLGFALLLVAFYVGERLLMVV